MSSNSQNNNRKNGHPAHLAHQFDTLEQQFQSGKLGIWLFLVTEILLFSGLFCVYAVYRSSHPDIFYYGHRYLDTTLGALNTAVLIFSSFTMAWAVRSAQRGKRRSLIVLLTVTLACAFVFLGVKYVEYEHKWKDGLLPGKHFHPVEAAPGEAMDAGEGAAEQAFSGAEHPRDVQLFFSIYFLMTGLHALHVLAGMTAIGWMIVRARRGDFIDGYFYPVDYTGLYWHLVDLIWIYLFPLLYLIH
jgi:cytochrome c oxidase subunit 3